MNAQYKKGILELLILSLLLKEPLYGLQIILRMHPDIGISEGTIYPLLKRLKDDELVSSFWQETAEGPPRKYYFITEKGKKYYLDERRNYIIFDNAVNSIIRREHE